VAAQFHFYSADRGRAFFLPAQRAGAVGVVGIGDPAIAVCRSGSARTTDSGYNDPRAARKSAGIGASNNIGSPLRG
jgi:hypothetical protein